MAKKAKKSTANATRRQVASGRDRKLVVGRQRDEVDYEFVTP
jgi:hypothetical protein